MATGQPTQLHRALAFHCVLGKDKLLLRSARVSEELGRLFEIEAELVSDDPNLDFDTLVGSPALIRLEMTDRRERYFHGVISYFTLDRVEGGTAFYRATLVPWLWLLTRTSDCRIFQQQSIPDIVKEVFRDFGFSDFEDKCNGRYLPWDYCVQYRETAFNFISRLLEHEGIYYYFRHERDKHVLVLCDDPACHKTPSGYKQTCYRPEAGVRDRECISDWRHEQHVATGTYALNEYNFLKPRVSMKNQANASARHQHAQMEIYDYPGEFEEHDEGADYSKIRLQELKTMRRTFRGTANDRDLAAGFIARIADHPRRDLNGNFLLVAATHQLTSDEYYAGDGGSDGEDTYTCAFTAIPGQRQFRPARLTPKPVMQGVQTAIVTGPAGQEVYIDDHARVKVQFHWDRRGQKDQNSSCWVRVSQAWAGKGYGFISHPRIGQEVIVDFEEGDPDRPIITGRVYNADQKGDSSNAGRGGKPGNAPPSGHPQSNMMTSFKSNSTPGGGGSNEITMNDSAGAEGLFFKAQKDEIHNVGNDREDTVGNNETRKVGVDRSREVGNNETVMIGKDREKTVVDNETLNVGKNRTRTVGMNEMVTVALTRTHTVGVNEAITVGAAQEITVGGLQVIGVGAAQIISVGLSRTTSIGKDDSLTVGKMLSIDTGDEIKLQTGAASITMKKDGSIEIRGGDIKIIASSTIETIASGDHTLKGMPINLNP